MSQVPFPWRIIDQSRTGRYKNLARDGVRSVYGGGNPNHQQDRKIGEGDANAVFTVVAARVA